MPLAAELTFPPRRRPVSHARPLAVAAAAAALAALVVTSVSHPDRTRAPAHAAIPLVARLAVARGLGGDDHALWAMRTAGTLSMRNRGRGLSATFAPAGPSISAGSARLALSLVGLRRGSAWQRVGAVTPAAHANRVSYRHRGLTEWWANGPLGLEQGITLRHAPLAAHGGGPLTLAIALHGTLRARSDHGAVVFGDRRGHALLRYSGLAVSDARGRPVPAHLTVSGRRLSIQIEDAHARYPLTVDPLVQSAKLARTAPQADDGLGVDMAMSGSTIVVGAEFAASGANVVPGAAYVYTEPSTGWADATQTATLTASDGVAGDGFGFRVAIDGATIVVGAQTAMIGSSSDQGAAYVFSEPPGGWADATQTAKLVASNAAPGDKLGADVGVSGSTVVAGATGNHALYVFTMPPGGWVDEPQKAKLTESGSPVGDALGAAVAIDGSTIVGGSDLETVGANAHQGAAYVYVEPPGGWANATQTARLTAAGGQEGALFGISVAVSGTTVAIGAIATDPAGTGRAYVFTQPLGGWIDGTQTATLVPSDGQVHDQFGFSVATDGSTVAVGADDAGGAQQGAVYLYTEPGGGWADETESQKLVAADGVSGDNLGWSVALSGTTVVGGAAHATIGADEGQGAIYVFGPPPPVPPPPSTTAPTVPPPPPPVIVKDAFVQALTVGDLPAPVRGSSVNIARSQGTVTVLLPGTKTPITIAHAAHVPLGSVIDTTHGRITLYSAADAKGTVQHGIFYGGMFRITQAGPASKPVTVLTLTGGNTAQCRTLLPPRHEQLGRHRAHAARGRRRADPATRHVWGNAHGQFRTVGKGSAATVRGTVWEVEDHCFTTQTFVRTGVVDVHDDHTGRTITLLTGQRYTARA